MGGKSTHRIAIRVFCRRADGTDEPRRRPGRILIEQRRSTIGLAGDTVGAEFEISGTDRMAGCDRPCTVAYFGSHKATYLFGDIEPGENIDDLVAFARQYASLSDGWCSPTARPPGLSDKTLAPVPTLLPGRELEGSS